MILLLVAAGSGWSHGEDRDNPVFADLLHRGFELHKTAHYQAALSLLRQAWKLEPRDYFVNLLLGIDLLRTHDAKQAVVFLKTANHLRPEEEFPYEYLGEAQASLGHNAEAAESYMKAMRVDETSADAVEGWADFSLERFRQLAEELRSSQRGLAAEYRLQA